MNRLAAPLLACAALAPLAGCRDVPMAPPPGVVGLQKTAGDNQTLLVGIPGAPLVVTVTDEIGAGVAGITVTWTVTGGNAAVSPATSVTDSSGRASTTPTLASAAQSPVTITAAVTGLNPQTFTLVAGRFTLVASVPIVPTYGIHDQFVRDGLVFVSAWNNGLRIYDVGNGLLGGSPAQPRFVDSIVTSSNGLPGGAAVHNAWWFWSPTGQKRYVFVGQEGPGQVGLRSTGDIHVVDVTDLFNPVEVAFYHMADVNGQTAGTHNFWVDEANQVLFAAYYNGGVVALDISGNLSGDLAQNEIARIRPGGSSTYVWGVQLHQGAVYATDMVNGLYRLSFTGSAFGAAGGGNVPERFTSDLWVHGGHAYTGTWGNRSGVPGNAVKIWAVGAGAPVLVDSIITPDILTVSDLEVSDDGRILMFSAEGGPAAGIYFYDVSTPTDPVFLGTYSVPAGVHTTTFATIAGRRYVFAAKDPPEGGPALLILDVTGLWP